MALEGRLLEIQKTIYPNSISLRKSKSSLSWRAERGSRVTASPRVWVPAVLQKGNVNTQYEATGHTNLFSNLFYFSSTHLCRQIVQETSHILVRLSLPQFPKAGEYCQHVACFLALPSGNDALSWNKIDWKTNWYALALPAVLYYPSKLVLPPTLYWNRKDPNHRVKRQYFKCEDPTQP